MPGPRASAGDSMANRGSKHPGLTANGLLITIVATLVVSTPVSAEESSASPQSNRPKLGGPDAIENQMESDRIKSDVLFESTLFKPYFAWKQGISNGGGPSLGSDYTSVYLDASDNLPGASDDASSGMVRFFGTWELFGRGEANTGTLSFKFDHRHRYTNTPPNAFSIDNLGYIDSMASTFNDEGWRLTNLHWRQSWSSGEVIALGGLLSVPDFFDIFALGSPWLHFQSLAFTTGSGTISLPGDAALGVIIGGWLNENLYIMGGFEDANSLSDDPTEGFDTFINDNEYFKHIEIGWTTSRDRAYLDNFHLSLWQVDEREKAGVKDGWGGVLSFTHYVGDRWMPFVRAGYAKDGSSPLEKTLSAGLAYQPNPIGMSAGDLLAFGANWGKPNETVFGDGLDEQYAFELFYRLQVTQELAITPDIQFLIDPALNPEEDSIWVFGVRARLAL
jgi:porin